MHVLAYRPVTDPRFLPLRFGEPFQFARTATLYPYPRSGQ